MSKIKKLILGLSVALTMAIAFVVGAIGLNHNKPITNSQISSEVETGKVQKPTSYTYAPNQVEIVKGGDTLNFVYQPDSLSQATSYVKAYEYIFGSTMDETMAVNLKYIDTSEVNVSYVYSSTQLDTTQSITGETTFTTQTIENNGDYVYIYILVSPINTYIPASFTKDIVWWFGVAGTLNVTNPSTNQTFTQTIVKGQPIDVDFVKICIGITGEAEWYYDEECTIPVTDALIARNKPLYIKGEVSFNLPSDWLKLEGDHYMVTKGTTTLPNNLVLPAYYNGLPVTQISSYAFQSYTNLISVDLSKCIKLTSIGLYAFRDCSELTSITLPSSLISIGGNAFDNCSGLTSITLPRGLTSIGYGAFYGCYALAEVYNLSSLTITVGSSDNGHVGYYAAVVYTDTNTVGSIQTIGNMRYYENGTDFIAVGPTSIDVTSVTLDSKTTAIKNFAFDHCEALTSIDLPAGVTSIGNSAFNECTRLTSITLPSSVKSIGNGVFSSCYNLTSITLPSSLTSIGNSAFSICSSLTSITLPSSVKSIGNSAFSSCNNLTSIIVESNNTVYDSRNNCNAIIETATNTLIVGCKNTVVPNNVTSIGNYAFSGCSGLISVDLSGCTSLTSIGNSAFSICSSLTSIDLSGCTSLTSIGNNAFSRCSGLTSIDLSECTSLTSIGGYAFNNCSGLTSITLPASLTIIGSNAFSGCNMLTSLTFASGGTWYYTSNYDYTGGTEFTIVAGTNYATEFKETYRNYYWYKV